MGVQFSQLFPPSPTFTERDLPSLKDKVFLITGGTSGIGFELAKILYHAGGKVYITGRTEAKSTQAIQAIRDSAPPPQAAHGPGQIDFIILNLDDLASIKLSTDAFKEKESRIDVLWNNAGVSQPPLGSISNQGYELQLATNCYGPFLFTQLLLPLLEAGASSAPEPGSVRVVWLSSQVAELSSPPEGLILSELTSPPEDNVKNYTNSKVGNWFLSAEFARRYGDRRIVSVALNPGAANSNLLRNAKWMRFFSYPLLHNPVQAAYTELYAGLSGDISLVNNGCYVIPWGRIHQGVAANLLNAIKVIEDGGTGRAKKFWEFCEERVKDYY
jgi:NAD(P)-dependent dehydrogenase (short-subunit alcohol dehydrogenase family)